MPKCKNCGAVFDGAYRMKYCSDKCRILYRTDIKGDNDCWEWNGATTKAGYGLINKAQGSVRNGLEFVHRLSYKVFVGDFDKNLFVCHKCDNPRCVNPNHLFVGTHSDNMADMARKGRAAWHEKKMPDELRKKMSESHKGFVPTKEQIIKAHEALDKIRTEDPVRWAEIVEKRIAPQRGRKLTGEKLEKLREVMARRRGIKRGTHSDDAKRKIGDAVRRRALINQGLLETAEKMLLLQPKLLYVTPKEARNYLKTGKMPDEFARLNKGWK